MTNFDIESTETLICPYCGAEQEDAREQEEWGTPEDWTCSDCTRDFVYTTETVLKFTSEDLGNYLDSEIDCQKYNLLCLQKDLEKLLSLEKTDGKKVDRTRARIEIVKKKISKLEERFDDYCKQKFISIGGAENE